MPPGLKSSGLMKLVSCAAQKLMTQSLPVPGSLFWLSYLIPTGSLHVLSLVCGGSGGFHCGCSYPLPTCQQWQMHAGLNMPGV